MIKILQMSPYPGCPPIGCPAAKAFHDGMAAAIDKRRMLVVAETAAELAKVKLPKDRRIKEWKRKSE